ncbi:MAG: zinc ribbon domain-containing protein [Terrimicrobiaceae bacterium]
MLDVIEKLLALQDRDQRLRAFQSELAHLPDERKAREKQIADSAARLEQAKTRVKEIEVEKKTLELDAQSKRDAISRYKTQQLQTRKNEEYTALAHEVESAEKAIRAIEDKELDLMEEVEQLKPQIAAAEKTHAEEKAKIEQVLAGLDAKKANLDSRIAELQADRARFTEGVDEDVLERYERLFQTKNGTALSPLEHEVCMGCHMKVTTQTGVQVKSQKDVVHCPQCGRILYLPA